MKKKSHKQIISGYECLKHYNNLKIPIKDYKGMVEAKEAMKEIVRKNKGESLTLTFLIITYTS